MDFTRQNFPLAVELNAVRDGYQPFVDVPVAEDKPLPVAEVAAPPRKRIGNWREASPNLLTYVEERQPGTYSRRRALYRCECGALVEAYVGAVRAGNKKSCGCLKRRKAEVMGD